MGWGRAHSQQSSEPKIFQKRSKSEPVWPNGMLRVVEWDVARKKMNFGLDLTFLTFLIFFQNVADFCDVILFCHSDDDVSVLSGILVFYC